MEYNLDGKEIYDFCKDNIGKIATCDLKVTTYKDGTIKRKIVEIKGLKE